MWFLKKQKLSLAGQPTGQLRNLVDIKGLGQVVVGAHLSLIEAGKCIGSGHQYHLYPSGGHIALELFTDFKAAVRAKHHIQKYQIWKKIIQEREQLSCRNGLAYSKALLFQQNRQHLEIVPIIIYQRYLFHQ